MTYSQPDAVFDRPKVRYLILWGFAFSFAIGIGIGLVAGGSDLDDPIWVSIIYMALFGLLSLWLLQRFKQENIELRFVLGKLPENPRWRTLGGLTIAALIFSLASFMVVFAALSYPFSDFVELVLQEINAEANPQTANPFLHNLLYVISSVLVAPIAEELMFRGFILQRWAVKWNVPVALIVSSVLFGLLHSNPVGLTMFGLIVGLLYLKTRSLLIPIVVHAFNNLLAAGVMLLPRNPNAQLTLTELRSSAGIGILLILVSAPWLIRFVVKNFPSRHAEIPYRLNAREVLPERL